MEEPQDGRRGNELLRYAAGCLRRAASAVIDAQGVVFRPEAEPPRRDPREVLDGVSEARKPDVRAAIATEEAAKRRRQLDDGDRHTLAQLQRLDALEAIDLSQMIAVTRYDVEAALRTIERYEEIAAEARGGNE